METVSTPSKVRSLRRVPVLFAELTDNGQKANVPLTCLLPEPLEAAYGRGQKSRDLLFNKMDRDLKLYEIDPNRFKKLDTLKLKAINFGKACGWLGISPGVLLRNPQEISVDGIYRKLLLKYHPDKRRHWEAPDKNKDPQAYAEFCQRVKKYMADTHVKPLYKDFERRGIIQKDRDYFKAWVTWRDTGENPHFVELIKTTGPDPKDFYTAIKEKLEESREFIEANQAFFSKDYAHRDPEYFDFIVEGEWHGVRDCRYVTNHLPGYEDSWRSIAQDDIIARLREKRIEAQVKTRLAEQAQKAAEEKAQQEAKDRKAEAEAREAAEKAKKVAEDKNKKFQEKMQLYFSLKITDPSQADAILLDIQQSMLPSNSGSGNSSADTRTPLAIQPLAVTPSATELKRQDQSSPGTMQPALFSGSARVMDEIHLHPQDKEITSSCSSSSPAENNQTTTMAAT